MMPAVACATVGLFFVARSIVCANVSEGNASQARQMRLVAQTSLAMCLALLWHSTSSPTKRLNDDIQDRNEQDVEERREQHPTSDGGADRVPAFLSCT